MGLNQGFLTADRTSASDECYTPFYAVEPLLEFIPKAKTIWCPFDEEWSAFYVLLKEKGYDVVRSSLAEGQDFFTFEPERWDILISNPPFSKKDAVLKRAYSFDKPFALLLPLTTLQGISRFKTFDNDIQLLSFDKRIGYHTKAHMGEPTKSNFYASAYFCRNLLPTKLELRELNLYGRALTEEDPAAADGPVT